MSFEFILLALLGAAVLAVLADLAYKYSPKVHQKVEAEIAVLWQQAVHIEQTAAAEAANLKETIVAYEKQGVAKYRTVLLAASADLAKFEAALGFKVKGAVSTATVTVVSPVPADATVTSVGAVAPATVTSVGAVAPATVTSIGAVPSDAIVYAGQPSPGAGVNPV